jgi:hypothetical protein
MDAKFLGKLYRQLKRNHPELIGLGIGWRTKRGRIQKQPAIRLVVEKKRSARAKSVRHFPKQIVIKAGRGKRPISMRIFTDVEEAGEWLATSFPLLVNGVPEVTASCYASWHSPDGVRHVGIVTVAHAFQGPGQPVGITVGNGVITGFVSLRSDLIRDGLDVGLVEMQQDSTSFLPCLPHPMNPGAASVNATINILGLSDTDALVAAMGSWFSTAPAQGRALSYYVTRTVQTPTGTSYELKSVVLADGPPNTFTQGRSGSPWVAVSSAWNPLAIGIQSHGHVGLSFRLGLGTHLATALQWLSQRPGVQNFSWAWRTDDLP